MKIEFAFSLEYKDIVDAEEAYDLYWANCIGDKRNFECTDENCQAQITCANLDKLRKDMKVLPYFRLVGEHSATCLYQQNQTKYYSSQANNERGKNLGTISNKSFDVLHFDRPDAHRQKQQKSSQLNLENNSTLIIKKKTKNNSQAPPRIAKNRYSIRPIINNFHKYKREQSLANNYIKIKTAKVSYSEMFVAINSQSLDELSRYKRIYWGRAKLYKNQSYYNILFTNYLTLNSEQIRPSIYITPELIEEAFCRTLMEKKFKELSNCSIYCFIYAKPYPNNKKSNNRNFINFYIDNLDFLEIKQEF